MKAPERLEGKAFAEVRRDLEVHFERFGKAPYILGVCNICGKDTAFFCDKGIDFYRESLFCAHCNTISRYRSLAHGLLFALGELTGVKASSVSALQTMSSDIFIKIYDTQSPFYFDSYSYPLPDMLALCSWIDIQISVYKPQFPLGAGLGKNITNQNLERLTYPDNSFDIILTSDVMEHIRLDNMACGEIQRVLRPGGYYIFTVPHFRNRKTMPRIAVIDPSDPSKDRFLVDPEYHGDVNSEDNRALCYRSYGVDLDDMLRDLGFSVTYLKKDFPENGIMNTEVFICRLENKPQADKAAMQTVGRTSGKVEDPASDGRGGRLIFRWLDLLRNSPAVKNIRRKPNGPTDAALPVPALSGAKGHCFEDLLMKKYCVKNFDQVSDPVKKMWLNFALRTVERGEEVKDLVSQFTGIRGKRYLDVGCGYGGFLVAFKKAGAKDAVGIEIHPVFAEYSDALAKDYGTEFSFFQKNVLNTADIESLGMFDILTCCDVLEHVEDPELAIANISLMMKSGGLALLKIPNRFYPGLIGTDPHFQLFGITLLPKKLADRYLAAERPGMVNDVHYFGLKYYLDSLSRQGVRCTIVQRSGSDPEEKLRDIQASFTGCQVLAEKAVIDDPVISDMVRRRSMRVRAAFESGYTRYKRSKHEGNADAPALAERLITMYGIDFWEIIAIKEDRS